MVQQQRTPCPFPGSSTSSAGRGQLCLSTVSVVLLAFPACGQPLLRGQRGTWQEVQPPHLMWGASGAGRQGQLEGLGSMAHSKPLPGEVFLPRGTSPGWRMALTFWDPNATPAREMPGFQSTAKNISAAHQPVCQLTSHALPFSPSLLLSLEHLSPGTKSHMSLSCRFFFFSFFKNIFLIKG